MQNLKKHEIVFEVNIAGAEQWEGVLTNVENLQKAFANEATGIEVVAHAKGIGLILKTNGAMQERLQTLADKGVVFAACENTLRRMQLQETDLMPLAKTVDSGIAEVVRKQEAGWSYIKSGS